MELLLGAVLLLLSGLDCYTTYSRINKYGPRVELNPLVAQLCADYGSKIGVGFLVIQNVAIACGLVWYGDRTLLGIFAGLKLGLAAMQLKSMQLERILERLLEIRNVKSNPPH